MNNMTQAAPSKKQPKPSSPNTPTGNPISKPTTVDGKKCSEDLSPKLLRSSGNSNKPTGLNSMPSPTGALSFFPSPSNATTSSTGSTHAWLAAKKNSANHSLNSTSCCSTVFTCNPGNPSLLMITSGI